MTEWHRYPLKHLAEINGRALPENTPPETEFRYVDIAAVGSGLLVGEPAAMTFREAPSRARRLVRPGDTIISTVRTYLRAVWPVAGPTGDLVVSTGFAVLSPRSSIDPRFLGWLAQSDAVIEEIVARSVGVGYPAINAAEIGDIEVVVPELREQRAIADYLDERTSVMNDLIEKKWKLVRLLQEEIDAAILDLIGRSELVQGQKLIPALPLRRLLAKQDRMPIGETQLITAFRDGQVTARSLRRLEGFTESWTEGAKIQGVQRGDIVVHGLDGFAGAIGTSEADGGCSPVYHVCMPVDGGDADFYGGMLRVLATTGYLGNFATSTRERAVDFRNWDLFGRIPVPAVEPDDQRWIGNRVRALRPIRDRVKGSERLLFERRKALISGAVAGRLEISGAAA